MPQKKRAGSAEAGLHLVCDQDDPVLVADCAQPFQKLWGRLMEAPSPWTDSRMMAATRAGSTSPSRSCWSAWQR
jgi:hypothetical protein